MKNIINPCLILFSVLLFKSAFAQNPMPFKEEILTLKLSNGALEGTLVMPNLSTNGQNTEGVTPMPLVFIIAGSGPTDRDCNSKMGIKCDAFKMLAEGLAAQNIASFRYDKRHIGKSKMTQKVIDATFEDFVEDAVRWLDTLKSTKRFSKIVVAGHSEGSLIGSIAVQKTACGGFISMCGVNEAIDTTMDKQLRKQSPPLADELKSALAKWKKGEDVDSVSPVLKQIINPNNKKFTVSFLQYSPKLEFSKVTIPVLCIAGKNDIQVLYEDALLFSKFNKDCTFKAFENMIHVLKDGTKNLNEVMKFYNDPKLPLTEGLVQTISDFVKSGATIGNR